MSKDYYDILGVPKGATADDVKKAFRRLAHEHHPDKGGDQQKFKDINEAYQVLGDAEKRATYDRFGSAAFEQGGMGTGGFGGFGGFQQGGFNINMDDMGDLGDILGGMFGFGGGRGARHSRGQDIHVDVTLEFQEAVFGATKTVKLYKHDACTECGGSGAAKGSGAVPCKDCGGNGSVTKTQRTMFGNVQIQQTCSECHGRGKVPETLCATCKGLGIERRHKEISIAIPAGISEGETIRVAGEGEHPGRGANPGDLFLRIHVRPHRTFTREGSDIHSVVQAPYSMVALGGSIAVATVDGDVDLKIPAGAQSGTVFTLRGKGVPFLRSRGRGDHFVTIQTRVDTKMSREQRELLEKLRNAGL
ncbi:molecular chaperone DnaJ [Candidatus Uhrbacteria bacterium]|nr:molecular chaperone DnaJ [Candidatus Uhrbacteria bacterium]